MNDITLVCIDSVDIERAIDAIEICKYYFEFKDIKLFTDIEYDYKHIIKIPKINSLKEYNRFVLIDLAKYIETEYLLICQWDGFILNPNAWTDEFLKYDYLGAPWKLRGDVIGNGGFSLRSTKLMKTVSKILSTYTYNLTYPEDFIICGYLRENLERIYNMKFPSIEMANKFSVEDVEIWKDQFGFHSFKKVDLKKCGWVPPKEINYLTDRFKRFNDE